MQTKKFVLDVHLGKLARHLRMVGFDSIWTSEETNSSLLQSSKEEARILLTQDRELFESAEPVLCHLVRATEPAAQLKEVLQQFELIQTTLSLQGFLSRCLECNSPLLPVSEKQIADRLPAHVQAVQKEFHFCTRCERIYEKGSHFERMKTWVKNLLAVSLNDSAQ